jgi:hypothetical protein
VALRKLLAGGLGLSQVHQGHDPPAAVPDRDFAGEGDAVLMQRYRGVQVAEVAIGYAGAVQLSCRLLLVAESSRMARLRQAGWR